MAIETNLSGSPYFDDFDDSKKYAKILFKPGTAVQVRELNQLQTQIQDQIEKFGDHIYQRGTIISGCQPTFISSLDYAKLTDVTENQSAVDLPAYRNLFVENSSGIKAAIVHTESGYESTDPDTNTLYLKYVQSGNDGAATKFSSGQSLQIFDNKRSIESIEVNSGGGSSGFANNDTLVILSALILANSSGGQSFAATVAVGETITQTTTGAQAVITAVNTSLYENKLVIEIEPIVSEVIIGNTASWSFTESQSDDYLITTSNSSITNSNPAYVSGFVGAGATGYIRTNTTGQIVEVSVSNKGTDYEIAPHVTVSSTRTPGPSTGDVSALSLSAKNYKAGVTVSSLSGSIGTAYAMEITEGLIYQKGFMLNTDAQFVIVSKYSSVPDGVQVGFVTAESIANSSIDTSLNDNSAGFENFAAPGANRLKLNPVLTTKTDPAAAEDPNFLGVWKFRNGRLSITKETTQYSTIGDEMAKRTFQEAGNFHVDGFKGSTYSADAISATDTEFSYVFDGGEAYIQGYRVTVATGATIKSNKATTTESETQNESQFDYGSYVDVTELAGDFDFTQGAQISLGDSAADAISDHAGDITTAVSTVTEIGKARIRAVVHDRTRGPQGQANTRHKAYLFDIKMNQGKSFFNVRSIFEGTNAVADILPQTAAGSQGQLGAILKQPNKTSQIVSVGQPLSSVSNVVYDFRHKESTTASTSGVITLTNATNATFPYGTTSLLTNEQEDDIILVPEEDVVSTVALSGTVSGSGTTLTGTTTQFESELQAGDYFEAGGSVYRVVSVVNGTQLTYSPSATITGGTSAYRAFKQNVPVPMGSRADINASSTSTSLTINLPVTLSATKNFSIITKQRNSGSVAKGVTRGVYAYIEANTHFNGTTGPWCLGHTDAIRLRAVYAGPNTSSTNVTENFVIDQNHNDQYYGLSQLKLKTSSNYTLANDDVLLVKFDLLTTSTVNGAGVKTISSYSIDDEKEIGALTTANTSINTLEIPEFRSQSDVYYDLRECLDFRPKSANTVAIETDSTLAETNAKNPKVYGPTANATHAIETSRFTTQLRYPSPGAYLSYDSAYYKSRKDNIVLKTNGDIKVYEGGLNTSDPAEFLIYNVNVAAYPSYPENLSTDMTVLGDLRVLKDFNASIQRINRYTTKMNVVENLTSRYTMSDIAELEKRIKRLENLVTLDNKEKKVKELNIPSSIDPTIERFKFGYFVDAFFSTQYTELSSEENTASLYAGRLRPARKTINIPFEIADTTTARIVGKRVQFPYSHYLLTSQENVTDVPVPVVSVDPPPVTVGTQSRWIWNKGDSRGTPDTVWTNKTATGSSED